MPEFSLDGYRELLVAFKNADYTFCKFAEIDQQLIARGSFVVLRHDIDISLRPALDCALMEREYEVCATYFVLLRSPFYNLLSRSSREVLLKIHQLGHSIALHCDVSAYDDDYATALREIEVLAQFYPYVNTHIVSIHSPKDISQIPIHLFPSLHAVYGPILQGKMAYISDSTGRWRYGSPLEAKAFHDRQPVQLLIHPLWWTQHGETAIEKLEHCLQKDEVNSLAVAREFLPKLFKSE